MPDNRRPRKVDEALKHVAQGFAVMSVWSTDDSGVCKCVKGTSCTSPGKHPIPRDGFLAASRDPAVVEKMMSAASEPNYGIVWPEGVDDVVFEWDVDGADWKKRTLDLTEQYGRLPPTKTTRTPSGGLHVFYRWPRGIPVPEGNTLHGFVVRWPWKGYVVGPGSRINGKVYESVGPTTEIADFPLSWAVTGPVKAPPLITVEQGGYLMPELVATGHRHDEIARYVASRWNKGLTIEEIYVSVRDVLEPRFVEDMDEARLRHEVTEAFNTAQKKWQTPGGGESTPTVTAEGVEIDALAIESRIERPEPLDLHKVPVPVGIAMLLDHLAPLTDAPFSSLTLASVVGLAGLMGAGPTMRWRGTQRLILYGALVGDSNYARKGQAISEVLETLGQIDPLLDTIRVPYIPSSGPAFIDTLSESKGTSVLMVAREMGRVLANAARETETLSYDMRDAWDGVPVGGRTRKTGKISADNYHLSILGATTPEDLVKSLTDTDLRNGWANRWLWFWAEKRQGTFKQTGENKVDAAMQTFIGDGIEFARRMAAPALVRAPFSMGLTPAAEALLDRVSLELDVPAHGTVGVLRQRMPPIAVRIGMVAALLDQTRLVDVEHLDFGFALTDYAVQSIRAVFGTRMSDPVAQNIIDILRQPSDGWLSTSQIARSLHKSGDRVNRALHLLLDAGLIVRETRSTGGRPSVGYRLTTP